MSYTLKILEWGCWLLGAVLLAFVATQWALAESNRQESISTFELAYVDTDPDQSLWSDDRKSAWAQLQGDTDPVLAILSMPDLGLNVPVYDGSEDRQLDLGAGLIPGTALPGATGNVGIAAHRDGYFRVLKDVELGQRLTLMTEQGLREYRVTETMIVDPLDVEVLDPTDTSVVTLVTCYPFYFVGAAPQRFIVRAELGH